MSLSQYNTVTFSKKATCQTDGTPVDQLNRQADALQFSFDEDEVSYMLGKNGDLLMVFSNAPLGTLTVRVKPSSQWRQSTLPGLRGRPFSCSFTDKNQSTRFTAKSPFASLPSMPDEARGAPDLNAVEVAIRGAFKLAG